MLKLLFSTSWAVCVQHALTPEPVVSRNYRSEQLSFDAPNRRTRSSARSQQAKIENFLLTFVISFILFSIRQWDVGDRLYGQFFHLCSVFSLGFLRNVQLGLWIHLSSFAQLDLLFCDKQSSSLNWTGIRFQYWRFP